MERYCEICKKVTEQDLQVWEDIKVEPNSLTYTPTGNIYICKECGSVFMGINTNKENV